MFYLTIFLYQLYIVYGKTVVDIFQDSVTSATDFDGEFKKKLIWMDN